MVAAINSVRMPHEYRRLYLWLFGKKFVRPATLSSPFLQGPPPPLPLTPCPTRDVGHRTVDDRVAARAARAALIDFPRRE